ncbi:MAG: sigma-54-dependent Fis family transcriptional regulator [Bacteroidota bacterium]
MTEQKLDSIIELASVLARQSDFQEILRLVTQKAAALFHAETALIMMINPSTRETVKTLYRHGGDSGPGPYQLLHTYLSGWILEKNSGLISENIHSDDRFRTELFEDIPVKSVMCIPFRGDGLITGTLLLLNQSQQNVFNKYDFAVLEKFAAIASPFLRNVQKIQEYFQAPLPEANLIKKYQVHGLLGISKPFIELLHAIDAATKCDVRVILEGASGTGKELVAKAIHHFSSRAEKKFIAIDCGAIPRDLLESELFGHMKGAFTGALETRKGLMEEADGGILFMDEITSLPLDLQAKLLRVLQENEIRPLGSNQLKKINVRIIAASSAPLRQIVEDGSFREDLFYRLYVYPIAIPTLNERKTDIPLLAKYFLKKFARQQNKLARQFSTDMLVFLKNQTWTGNVRELENLVERLLTVAAPETEILGVKLLPEEFRQDQKSAEAENTPFATGNSLRENLAAFEKDAIENALKTSKWNQSEAARMLGVSEHTIRYKMKNLGIIRQY